MAQPEIIKELGDGLILRRATVEDAEALATFNGTIHKAPDDEAPDEHIVAWTMDLMTRPHPTFQPEDFTLVVDLRTEAIVSCMNLISQTWSYEGIPFGVGRPELVGTDPQYRRRGLIRAQFDVIHQWSAQRGQKAQAITGIPYYYRQFGYEMCLSLDGSRLGYQPHIPRLKAGEEERFSFRPATVEDIPLVMEAYEEGSKRNLVACCRTREIWRYDMFEKNERIRAEWVVIEDQEGVPVGFLAHSRKLRKAVLSLWGFELKAGVSYLDVTPAVIRYLARKGEQYAARDEKADFQGYRFSLGLAHPAYEVLPERMPRVAKPYAWYLRVPDLPDFLQHIAPVLEKRLADSPAVGFTGELKLNFYRFGVRLSFDGGRLAAAERYAPSDSEDGDVLFPDHTFLRALFGYNSVEELEDMFPDCYPRTDAGRALVRFLFPRKPSNVWAVN